MAIRFVKTVTGKAARSPNRAFDQYATTSDEEVAFFDDFLGMDYLGKESGSLGIWETVEVALNAAIANLDGEANGVCGLVMDSDSNAEDAVLYMGDTRQFDLNQSLFFECRCAVEVLPTTGVLVFGMAGDHHLTKDSVTEHAWFRMEDTSLLTESDDTTNDNNDIDTGEDIVAAAWHLYQIDFGNIANVKFFLDGVRVNASTTFDMSNLTDAEAIMQPYFSLDKGADAGVGSLYIDYVKIFSSRA